MTDMQASLPLLIVRPSILNPVMHFFTQPLTSEMKCPINIPLPCAFHFISSIVDATHAPTISQMIWSTSYHHVAFGSSIATLLCSSLLPWSIGANSLLKLLRHERCVAPKPPTCPSHLQPVHWHQAFPWSSPSSHMTPCHPSYAISSFIDTLVSISTYLIHLHLHGSSCSH